MCCQFLLKHPEYSRVWDLVLVTDFYFRNGNSSYYNNSCGITSVTYAAVYLMIQPVAATFYSRNRHIASFTVISDTFHHAG